MSTFEFLNRAGKTVAKNSEVKEVDIENKFCKYAKTKKCIAMKLVFLRKKGFPDRTILCPGGGVFFIEFKRKNKKQSPIRKSIQKSVRYILESLGFLYYVCDQIGQAETHLDRFLDVTTMESP